MSAVQTRFLNGDEETLEGCRTINDVRVQVANPRDIFAPDVCVLSVDQAVVLTDDDVPPPKVAVVVNEERYDDDRWDDALVAHAKAGDHHGVKRAMAKLEAEGRDGEVFCVELVCHLINRQSADADSLSVLIASHADVNFAPEENKTALFYAAIYGTAQIAQLLITARADANHVDVHRHAAMFYAAVHQNTGVAQMLIGAQANVNRANPSGDAALSIAAAHGNMEMVQLLISAGADLDHAGFKKLTALMRAADFGRIKVVQMLANAGAHINYAAEYGQTALTIAAGNRLAWLGLDSPFNPRVQGYQTTYFTSLTRVPGKVKSCFPDIASQGTPQQKT